MTSTLESMLQSAASKLRYTPSGRYPLTACNYFALFGPRLLGFSKISELHLHASQLTAINEGGSNFPYIVGDTKKDFHMLTFEKGYGTADLMQYVPRIGPLTVVVKGRYQTVEGVYYTNRAVMQDLVLSELNASTSELLIQRMTFAYSVLKKSDSLRQDLAKYVPQNDRASNHAAVQAAAAQNQKATERNGR